MRGTTRQATITFRPIEGIPDRLADLALKSLWVRMEHDIQDAAHHGESLVAVALMKGIGGVAHILKAQKIACN